MSRTGPVPAQVSYYGGYVWHNVFRFGSRISGTYGIGSVGGPYCDQFSHPARCYASVSAISTHSKFLTAVLFSNASRILRWHHSLTMAQGGQTGISGSCSPSLSHGCIVAYVVTRVLPAAASVFYEGNATGTSWRAIASPPKGTGTIRSISCVTGRKTLCWVTSAVEHRSGQSSPFFLLRYQS
jgi:hypothetical protein